MRQQFLDAVRAGLGRQVPEHILQVAVRIVPLSRADGIMLIAAAAAGGA